MRKNFTRLSFVGLAIFIAILVCGQASAQVSNLSEGFNDVVSDDPTPVPGWTAVNNSTGNQTAAGWLSYKTDADPTEFPFEPHEGNDFLLGSFYSADGGSTATISNWVISPHLNLVNDAVIKFWTTTEPGSPYPDRLEVRLSTAGTSLNVGSTPTSIGDFTTLLLTINSTLVVGGYPETWTEYSITLSGLPQQGTTGRIALRHFVTNGGENGDNSDIIGIDRFSFASPALPVSLLSFTGQRFGKTNKLKWSTVTEIDNTGFEIERSNDGISFAKIGFTPTLARNGNSSAKLSYEFIDERPFTTTNYYRLRQIDKNGNRNSSNIILITALDQVQPFSISAYPNPARSSLNLTIPATNIQKAHIAIFDISGKLFLRQPVPISENDQIFSFNISGFAKGIYLVKIATEDEKVIKTLKFVKE